MEVGRLFSWHRLRHQIRQKVSGHAGDWRRCSQRDELAQQSSRKKGETGSKRKRLTKFNSLVIKTGFYSMRTAKLLFFDPIWTGANEKKNLFLSLFFVLFARHANLSQHHVLHHLSVFCVPPFVEFRSSSRQWIRSQAHTRGREFIARLLLIAILERKSFPFN